MVGTTTITPSRRQRLLDELAAGPATLKQLAAVTGLRLTLLRDVLTALEADGLVQREAGKTDFGRPANLFRLSTPQGARDPRQLRTCLMCESEFMSPHAGVRRCQTCKNRLAREFIHPAFVLHT